MTKEPGDLHKKKFAQWQERAGKETRYLSQLVEEHVLPVFARAGFGRVDVALQRREWTVNSQEIRLERVGESVIDSIDIAFGKYGDPAFQIGFSRRGLAAPNAFIRSGTLVKRSDQRYCFWGKPKWWPSALWSRGRSQATVTTVASLLGQVIGFLDNGERGPNISAE